MNLPKTGRFVWITALFPAFEGLFLLLCIPYAAYRGEQVKPFFLPGIIMVAVAGLSFLFFGNSEPETSRRHLIVLLIYSWLILIIGAALPYILSGAASSPVDAFFEAASGITTTGSSVFTHLDRLPGSIVLWRSLTQWIGGMATLVSILTVFPVLNIGGAGIFSAGFMTGEGSSSGLGRTVKQVCLIYFLLTLVQVLCLYLVGMDLFGSLCYSFGIISTGSFSPVNEGMEGFSPSVRYIMTLFMFLSGAGSAFYYQAITGRLKGALKNEEMRFYGRVVLFAVLIIAGILYFKEGYSFGSAVRSGIFQSASFISNTGYSIDGYLQWPVGLLMFLLFLMIAGGGFTSPGGGIKLPRLLVLFKNFGRSFRTGNNPMTFPVKYNQGEVGENDNHSILSFIMIWGIITAIGVFVLTGNGVGAGESVLLVVSALSTFGHQFGLADLTENTKLFLGILMIAGKLQVYPLLVLFSRSFYKAGCGLNNMKGN